MVRSIFSIFILLAPFIFYSQEIKVVNEYYEPLEGVEIYSPNKSNSTKTSYKGVASLEKFTSKDTIVFFKAGYNFYTTNLNDLLINGIICRMGVFRFVFI